MYLLTNDGSQGEGVEFCKHDGIGRSISLKDLSKQELFCHLVCCKMHIRNFQDLSSLLSTLDYLY